MALTGPLLLYSGLGLALNAALHGYAMCNAV